MKKPTNNKEAFLLGKTQKEHEDRLFALYVETNNYFSTRRNGPEEISIRTAQGVWMQMLYSETQNKVFAAIQEASTQEEIDNIDFSLTNDLEQEALTLLKEKQEEAYQRCLAARQIQEEGGATSEEITVAEMERLWNMESQ